MLDCGRVGKVLAKHRDLETAQRLQATLGRAMASAKDSRPAAIEMVAPVAAYTLVLAASEYAKSVFMMPT